MARRRAEPLAAEPNTAWGKVQSVLAQAQTVAWKLAKSTGSAGWITATSCLILLVPLIIEMDREQQLVEFENQQLGALTGGAGSTGKL